MLLTGIDIVTDIWGGVGLIQCKEAKYGYALIILPSLQGAIVAVKFIPAIFKELQWRKSLARMITFGHIFIVTSPILQLGCNAYLTRRLFKPKTKEDESTAQQLSMVSSLVESSFEACPALII